MEQSWVNLWQAALLLPARPCLDFLQASQGGSSLQVDEFDIETYEEADLSKAELTNDDDVEDVCQTINKNEYNQYFK